MSDINHRTPEPGSDTMVPDGAPGRDYELPPELSIDAPAQLKALGDPLRNTIVDLVLERAMSVTELADLLDRPRGSVAYHVDVLVAAGLLQVVRTRQVRAIEERFYGRTALTFALPGRPGEIPFIRDVLAEMDVDRANDGDKVGTSTYRRARIPEHRVEEYAARLLELAVEFAEEPRGGDIEFGLYLAVFPTNRLPQRPSTVHDDRADGDAVIAP